MIDYVYVDKCIAFTEAISNLISNTYCNFFYYIYTVTAKLHLKMKELQLKSWGQKRPLKTKEEEVRW